MASFLSKRLALTPLIVVMLLGSFPYTAISGEYVLGTGAVEPYHNNKLTGIIDRILLEAFGRAGHQLTIQTLPSERSIVSANSGTLDGDAFRVEGLESEYLSLIQSDEPIYQSFYSGFTLIKIDHFSGLDSLEPYRIGIVRGHKVLEMNTEGMNRQLVNSATELFERLKVGSFDVVLMNRVGAERTIQALDLESINILEPPVLTRNMHFYMNREHEEVIGQVDQAIREMKQDGSYEAIVAPKTKQ